MGSLDNDAMFSVHVGPYEGGYRFLNGLSPLEPQMWMSLTSKKISWSQSRTKKLTVPVRDGIQPESHKAYSKHMSNRGDFGLYRKLSKCRFPK